LTGNDPHVVLTLDAVIAYLARELPQLMSSGDNWQVTLHGGRGGDVQVETHRKTALVDKRRRDVEGASTTK
jgi:hypothetical protein